MLSSQDAVHTDFVADVSGTYELSLLVNDGIVDSDASIVTIVAVSLQSALISSLNQSIDAINSLMGEDFKNNNMPKTLTKKITEVIGEVDEGNYQQAFAKLSNDVIAKTDGCAVDGDVDKNDWILSCSAQANVYIYLLQAKTALSQLLN